MVNAWWLGTSAAQSWTCREKGQGGKGSFQPTRAWTGRLLSQGVNCRGRSSKGGRPSRHRHSTRAASSNTARQRGAGNGGTRGAAISNPWKERGSGSRGQEPHHPPPGVRVDPSDWLPSRGGLVGLRAHGQGEAALKGGVRAARAAAPAGTAAPVPRAAPAWQGRRQDPPQRRTTERASSRGDGDDARLDLGDGSEWHIATAH